METLTTKITIILAVLLFVSLAYKGIQNYRRATVLLQEIELMQQKAVLLDEMIGLQGKLNKAIRERDAVAKESLKAEKLLLEVNLNLLDADLQTLSGQIKAIGA